MTWTYQPTEHLLTCALCGSPRSEWLWLADRDRSGYQATSVLCRNCGLVFLTPRMTAAGYAEFYGSGAYRETARQFGYEEQKLEAAQHRYAHSVGNWLQSTLPEPIAGGTLLDIGGSNGIVAAALKKRFGLESATVLEPSESEAAQAESRGIEVIRGLLETWEPGERQFSIVTIFQSVDHLLDIAGALRKVKRLLKPGGYFALDIVNFSFMLRHLKLEQCVKIDHPFYLMRSTMYCLLLRAGFEIVKHGNALEGRKVFFLCRHSRIEHIEPVIPTSDMVEKLIQLAEEARHARMVS